MSASPPSSPASSGAGPDGGPGELDVDRLRRTLESVIGIPATDGNHVTVLRNGVEIFPAMLDAIGTATRSIDFLTFVYWQGEIAGRLARAMADRARAGVRVRVLLDALGGRLIEDELIEEMREAGCQVTWFRPVEAGELGTAQRRTHRKILVCDETVGFTGGVGIADEWTGDAETEADWRDSHFRIEGPAVAGLRGAFFDNWIETGGTVCDGHDRFPPLTSAGDVSALVVPGDAETGQSRTASMFQTLFMQAERRLRIATAYFNPDETLLQMLVDTARRGVEVQLLLPGPHADKRFVQLASEGDYEQLLEAGVTIHNFQTSMLHAKITTVDGAVSVIGSANMNNRSTTFDEEISVVLFDRELTATLDGHFDHDLRASVEIDLERWKDRGLAQKAKESVIGVARGLI